ncbi:MAG TPA: hypothetical protein VNY05_11420 [Candidatus Acidoferrales bacterium]|nr:hypothetical protein [Candidatus Acidoferrales bacterium]
MPTVLISAASYHLLEASTVPDGAIPGIPPNRPGSRAAAST